jgi:uncharacterized hydrophobic protein (TIGR00271 family)
MRRQNVNNEVILRLYNEGKLTSTYLTLMVLAGILTTVAVLTNSVPVLIGAMVIAPALPPIALAIFGFAGGQPRMAIRGLGTAGLGFGVAILGAVLATWILQLTGVLTPATDLLHLPLIEERVRPGWYSLIAAAAAGVASVIGIVRNKLDTLIGTVAAVALVPAGCAAGISLVAGDSVRAIGGLVLLLINLMLICAAGLLTIAAVHVDELE